MVPGTLKGTPWSSKSAPGEPKSAPKGSKKGPWDPQSDSLELKRCPRRPRSGQAELEKCPAGTQGAEKGDPENRSTAHSVGERVFSTRPARETAPGYGGSGTASNPHAMEGVRPSEPILLRPTQT